MSAMNDLPRLAIVNEEVINFLQALAKQNEEHKLFQFLNGLDESYAGLRSQILLMNPLPSVESVYSMIQQEELQRQVLEDVQFGVESSALLSKNVEVRCSVCGNKGHTKEKCWQIIGYLSWHPRSKKNPQRKRGVNKQGQQSQSYGRTQN